MSDDVLDWLRTTLDAPRLKRKGRLQSLWSGYGEVVRYRRADGRPVVVKHVDPSGGEGGHPRGWNTNRSHARKLRSYAVEHAWYGQWASLCGDACRVPRCLAALDDGSSWTFVLEDLDHAGFPDRRQILTHDEVGVVLDWIAAFHATFLGKTPDGLWPVGTYWHLDTRPDELAATEDVRLREAAAAIDAELSAARFRTFVHGDAKVANFCFAPDGSAVAAVDFQYVGGGCGMKDVAYFLGSVWRSSELEAHADAAVDRYFASLRHHLAGRDVDLDALEAEWRALNDWAWADFTRFLAGWAPEHWKVDRYSLALTERVLRAVEARG